MEKTNGNDPINMNNTQSGEVGSYKGLTKREYFAAMALQGMMADTNTTSITESAIVSVKAADALIKALNQE